MEQRVYPKRCNSSSLAETVASIEQVLTEILVRVPVNLLSASNASPSIGSLLYLTLNSVTAIPFKTQTLHSLLSLLRDTPVSFVTSLLILIIFVVLLVMMKTKTHPGSGSPTCKSLDLDHNLSRNFVPSQPGSLPFNPFKFAENQYHDDARIIQSCKGLFLCRLLHSPGLNPPYFIFNPTTNQFSTLFPPPATAVTTATSQNVEPRVISIALAFDPSKSPPYKVVSLRTIDGAEECTTYHIMIYSSQTQSWRILDSSFKMLFRVFYGRAVYWNGAINWVGMFGVDLVYFHIDEEREGFIDSTHFYEKNFHKSQCRYFEESYDGRHLYLIDIYRPCTTKFEVLEMGKDYSGWSVKYLVDLDPICRQNPFDIFVVLFIDQDGNEEELLLHTPGKLISYNPKSKTYKSLQLTPKAGVKDHLLRAGRGQDFFALGSNEWSTYNFQWGPFKFACT